MGKKFKELKSKSQETQVADLNKLRVATPLIS